MAKLGCSVVHNAPMFERGASWAALLVCLGGCSDDVTTVCEAVIECGTVSARYTVDECLADLEEYDVDRCAENLEKGVKATEGCPQLASWVQQSSNAQAGSTCAPPWWFY